MDIVAVKPALAAGGVSMTPPVASVDAVAPQVAIVSPADARDTFQKILAGVRSLTPPTDVAPGNVQAGNPAGSSLFDPAYLADLPPGLQNALAAQRQAMLETMVPITAVNVTNGAGNSLKRMQQGQ